MSVVVGMQDPGYGESKAIELISEAKLIARQLTQPQPEEASAKDVKKLREEYQEKMSQAMSLLALSKVQRNGTDEDAKA